MIVDWGKEQYGIGIIEINGNGDKMVEGVIYEFTGNPFVDAGIWALSRWVDKKPEELNEDDLKGIIDDIIYVYLNKAWSKNLFSVFPNNPLTNPAVKDKKERYSKFLMELIEKIEVSEASGDCISCGRRNRVERWGKDKIPLTGSKKFVNYFSYATDGADYCPACTFAVQFVPIVMYACGNMLLLHSNSEKVMKYWSKRTVENVKKQIVAREFTGCFNEGYKNPINALFHVIQDVILHYNERWYLEKPSIDFYHFTNYNQGPDLNIYHVPTSVFTFLAYIPQHEKYFDWLKVVRRGYRYVNWEKIKEEGDYKNNPNLVYNNLLNGKSIIGFFIDRKNKEAIGGWDLIKNYLLEVRNMDEKRINTIKKIGDELADYIETAEDIKTLKKLETASNYKNYRNILRIVIKKRIENGIEDPLFTFDDYVNYLFPEGSLTWRETQDLILFRIYEKLQFWIIQQGKQDEIVTSLELEESQEEE
ncbi:type I-B CRISPR-associated protein Cas8b1/Cst1 [Methanobacterium aggregans]|uniref:type I-B CRISPR-associated protein Cas8b1/Cst1 n=1 Tax=Methanobacterium aggregans TaxID=1615586 RepID=UPI001FD92F6A|nr:type I-B CRISPR-associated protein Cas8b1/Cst1 [Methanobacterium aggregans]MBP2044951.1 CRISPR-associated protein Cst1 [Methanobacterium aggregans]